MQQFFDPLGFSFHQEIAHKYGPVVKLHGSFGRPLLYIYDPQALRTMIKEQDIYEEGSAYIKYEVARVSYELLSPY